MESEVSTKKKKSILIALGSLLKTFFLHFFQTLIFVIITVLLFLWGYHFEIFQKYANNGLKRESEIQMVDPQALDLHGLDWFPPQISIAESDRTINYSGTEFVVLSSERPVSYDIPEGWSLLEVKYGDMSYTAPYQYTYILKTWDLADGVYSHKISFTDEYGNSTEKTVNITAGSGRLYSPEWENIEYFTSTSSVLSIANKRFRLLSNYEPTDLVSLSSLGISNYNYGQLRSEAATHLSDMVRAITNSGIFYVITSSYRSYETQIHTYNYWYKQTGYDRNATDLKSARPGYSEHQLGLTVDFASNQTNFVRGSSLDNWLQAHAHEYGFVMSYPEGKESTTGYQYEPWHYRYVGVENATDIKSRGITLTEWLYEHWNVDAEDTGDTVDTEGIAN